MSCIFVTLLVIIKYNNFFAGKMYFTFPPQPPPSQLFPFLLSPSLPIHFPLFPPPYLPPFPFSLRYFFFPISFLFPSLFSFLFSFPFSFPFSFSFSSSFPSLPLGYLISPPPPGKNLFTPVSY